MRHIIDHATAGISRRSLIVGTAGTLAAGVASATNAIADSEAQSIHSKPLPLPKPIPGGLDIPPVIHGFVPGPETLTLPFSKLTLMGLNVEPSTVTDFQGVTALAYIVGRAIGSDGVRYDLESDVRVFEGQYVGEDGTRREGTFAFF
jgi:hypothetical protein